MMSNRMNVIYRAVIINNVTCYFTDLHEVITFVESWSYRYDFDDWEYYEDQWVGYNNRGWVVARVYEETVYETAQDAINDVGDESQ